MSETIDLDKLLANSKSFEVCWGQDYNTIKMESGIALMFYNYRQESDLTKDELAEKLFITEDEVDRIESARSDFLIEELLDLLCELDMEIEVVFNMPENEEE